MLVISQYERHLRKKTVFENIFANRLKILHTNGITLEVTLEVHPVQEEPVSPDSVNPVAGSSRFGGGTVLGIICLITKLWLQVDIHDIKNTLFP